MKNLAGGIPGRAGMKIPGLFYCGLFACKGPALYITPAIEPATKAKSSASFSRPKTLPETGYDGVGIPFSSENCFDEHYVHGG